MRRLDFGKGTEKNFPLAKDQRIDFFFSSFTKELINVLLKQPGTQPVLKGTLTLHELIIYTLNFCALSFML